MYHNAVKHSTLNRFEMCFEMYCDYLSINFLYCGQGLPFVCSLGKYYLCLII